MAVRQFTSLRVTPEEEWIGLNVAEYGVTSRVLELGLVMHVRRKTLTTAMP